MIEPTIKAGSVVGEHSGHESVASNRSFSALIPLLFFAAIILVFLIAIIVRNNGQFVYSLDDPYIHLRLADNIRQGHYGINLGEPAAPSSSIIWALLLAPFTALPFGDLAPLVFNILFAIPTIFLMTRLVERAFTEMPAAKRRLWVAFLSVLMVIISCVVSITFTGMEHVLQIGLTLLILQGLLDESETGRVSWWLIAAIAAAPLVRYESVAFSAIALAYLLTRRHIIAAIVGGAIIAGTLLAFSFFLHSQGLGWLPSSVVAKTVYTLDEPLPIMMVRRLILALLNHQGIAVFIGAVLLLFVRDQKLRPIAVCVALAGFAHMLVGRFDGFPRYASYLTTLVTIALLVCYQRSVVQFIRQVPVVSGHIIFLIGTIGIFWPSVYAVSMTVQGGHNIYQQQVQMARFVKHYYQAPVAVNDLGAVSWSGGQYTLDLWGLGSLEALGHRKNGDPVEQWIPQLTKAHRVGLVMVYDQAFPTVPHSWQKLGDLKLQGTKVTPAYDTVIFYATDQAAYDHTLPLLKEFVPTLPADATFTFAQ